MEKKKQRSHSDHRVHFDASSNHIDKNSEISCKEISDDEFEIHLGFLQTNYKYHIAFSVPRDELKIDRIGKLIPFDDDKILNLNCQASSISHGDDEIKFDVEYHTHKENKVDEILKYKLHNSKRIISIILVARILGKGQGTPLLKDGIRLLGVLVPEDDSDTASRLSPNLGQGSCSCAD